MLPTRLMMLPLLQGWDGTTLSLRLLTTPQGDPLAPLALGEPAFVDAALGLEVRLVADPGAVPTLASGFSAVAIASPAPPQARTLAQALQDELPIDATIGPVDPRSASVRFMKYAPPPYRDATGYRGGGNPFLVTDDSYHCALKAPVPTGTVLRADPPALPWGRVLAQALRQPLLAEALGLVRTLDVVPPADLFEDGGWIYVNLATGTHGASLLGIPGALKLYAARVPPLREARSLFSPVLFPVGAVPPPGVAYDTLFREAVQYDDGFAKAVYARQPIQVDPLGEVDEERPVQDLGVQLGWDDEQVVTWLNRQVDPAAATQDAPMGVLGYRVDARSPGGDWQPLVVGESEVTLGAVNLGPVKAEFQVEIAPNRLFGDSGPNWWVPSYYTAWSGPSLAAQDPVAQELRGIDPTPATVRGVDPGIALRYGEAYEFRVRLADLAGGGPDRADQPRNPAPQPMVPLHFLRWIRPGPLRLETRPPAVPDPDDPPGALVFRRPLLAYPAAVFAGGTTTEVLADLVAAKADQRAPGLPDRDASLLDIEVQVESPGATTNDGFVTISTTTRPFPATPSDRLTLSFDWQDVADSRALPVAATGPLALPTSRRVRLVLAARCPDRPDYFGAADVRLGPPTVVALRNHAQDERNLLRATSAEALQGIFLQPQQPPLPALFVAQKGSGHGVTAPLDPLGALSEALDLDMSATTLRARRGRRLVLGCSPLVRHTVGPDGASLTFASIGEVVGVWLVGVRLDLMRDWSWDGLDHLAILRDGTEVGRIEPRGRGGHEATGNAGRDRSELLFVDAIDPKPLPPEFPRPITAAYSVRPVFRSVPTEVDAPLEFAITLPATTPPAQVPRLVSAGMAMSPFGRDALYSRTDEREKRLWLEFAAPPADPKDLIFARVLASAADPLLTDESAPQAEMLDPPLAVDPEPIRRIVSGQGDDQAGAAAMQPLIATDSPVHFLLPLPPGLTAESPELFGFFTYEFRYGHTGFWTTAQGRYGRPLRVTGVQHAAPPLRCGVTRTRSRLEVSAAFANPVLEGRSARPPMPVTGLWALLYAQVHQADGTDRRNILLGVRELRRERRSQHVGRGVASQPEAAMAAWSTAQIKSALAELTLGPDAPLSCLAVETLPGDRPWNDPLGSQLGYERFLRTSALVPVPGLC